MQQIGNSTENIKAQEFESLLIWNNILVRECDVRWNSIEQSLCILNRKMLDLGFTFDGSDVICGNRENVEND
jgi:hypothetical protein